MTTTNSTQSVLVLHGYEILDCVNGVYRLRAESFGKVTFDGVGLFVTFGPLDGTGKVFFCEMNALDSKGDPAVIESMLTGWQLADARRLIESGVKAAQVDVTPFGKVVEDHVPHERPNGGTRYVSVMESGDVICHN